MTNDPRPVGDGELPVQPVAWSRSSFIKDNDGRNIGTDDPELAWGKEPPDEYGWSPLYAAPVGQPAPDLAGVLEALESAHTLFSKCGEHLQGVAQECCGCYVSSGHPEDPPECCGQAIDLSDHVSNELRSLEARITSLRARMGKPT